MGQVGDVELAAATLTLPEPTVALDRAAHALGSRRLRSVRHRIHHRPGRSITRVDHATLATANGTVETLLVTHAHRRGLPEGAQQITVEGAPVAVWTYPNDPYLPGLMHATDPAWIAGQWHSHGGELTGNDGVAPLILEHRSYRPTRGAVIEVHLNRSDVTERRAFLKVLRPARITRVADVHRRLADSFPVPRVIADNHDVLFLSALPGTPLRRALRHGDPLPCPQDLVDLSMRLAKIDADTHHDPLRRADPARARRRLARGPEDLQPTIRRVADAAAEARSTFMHDLVTVHADLHGGQLLTRDGQVSGLLDLDGVGPGLMLDDAATLIAYLEVQREISPASQSHARRYAEQVAMAYADMVDPDALANVTAGVWLELAAVASRSGDEAVLRRRVARADQLLR